MKFKTMLWILALVSPYWTAHAQVSDQLGWLTRPGDGTTHFRVEGLGTCGLQSGQAGAKATGLLGYGGTITKISLGGQGKNFVGGGSIMADQRFNGFISPYYGLRPYEATPVAVHYANFFGGFTARSSDDLSRFTLYGELGGVKLRDEPRLDRGMFQKGLGIGVEKILGTKSNVTLFGGISVSGLSGGSGTKFTTDKKTTKTFDASLIANYPYSTKSDTENHSYSYTYADILVEDPNHPGTFHKETEYTLTDSFERLDNGPLSDSYRGTYTHFNLGAKIKLGQKAYLKGEVIADNFMVERATEYLNSKYDVTNVKKKDVTGLLTFGVILK